MASDDRSPPSPKQPRSDAVIVHVMPTPKDVLFGRGNPVNQHPGNRRFRELVHEKKEAYNTARRQDDKQKIAAEIYQRVHLWGGRFLRHEDHKGRAVDVIEKGVWHEADEHAALEKVKMSLRQKTLRDSNEGVDRADVSDPLPIQMSNQVMPILPPMLYGAMPPPDPLNLAHLAVIPQSIPSPNYHSQVNSSLLNNVLTAQGMVWSENIILAIMNGQLGSDRSPGSSSVDRMLQASGTIPPAIPQVADTEVAGFQSRPSNHRIAERSNSVSEHTAAGPPSLTMVLTDAPTQGGAHTSGERTRPNQREHLSSGDEAADFLAFCAQASDQPFFSEEQVALERASLTDDEIDAALADMYGRKCTISGTHQRKRAKKDHDECSVKFLVNEMRVELERMPEDKKCALLEAQRKCHPGEFSDTRLEHFLRCEGMNAQLGAQRFVNYWESRRELFGPEKFLMRMTLSEALRDDYVALETCMLFPLPHTDSSGRQLIFVEPCHHTREGYSSENMLRAIWYVIEVMAQSNSDPGRGFVVIRWDKNTTIWSHDSAVFGRVPIFLRTCWPVRIAAVHICCAPWYVTRIFKPFMSAFMDRQIRSRIQIHDVPEGGIVSILSGYGIERHMLPIEMGGTVRVDRSEWLANRRAAELEEI